MLLQTYSMFVRFIYNGFDLEETGCGSAKKWPRSNYARPISSLKTIAGSFFQARQQLPLHFIHRLCPFSVASFAHAEERNLLEDKGVNAETANIRPPKESVFLSEFVSFHQDWAARGPLASDAAFVVFKRKRQPIFFHLSICVSDATFLPPLQPTNRGSNACNEKCAKIEIFCFLFINDRLH